MNWLSNLMRPKIKTSKVERSDRGAPDGLWTKCDECKAILYRKEMDREANVCPRCGAHHRLGARGRAALLLDPHFTECDAALVPGDPLGFKDSKKYRDRVKETQKKTGEKESALAFSGACAGVPTELVVFEFAFQGGSMGSVVGEKIVRAVNRAIARRAGLVVVSASGGARMQEGTLSLMQMAKTSAALQRLEQAKLPYISVLTDPTMGGVSASFAMLGDVIVAEPKALIGFAGPRVIEQTIRQTLPEGFQRAEYLLEHGNIDLIVDRRQMRDQLAQLLATMLGLPEAATGDQGFSVPAAQA
ncbi:MAG: acetyl-CoA carboxylase carboxyl transferase subunit beta [Alphaproteobacteria bacterium CG_4_10_14_0_2_um_filter_63_37]|nr:MAG: acetyl-CoA carboxylase subunit beta [Proteobacteria bacterium CG1_02_64_396]PJA23478.1 MAG: acetyl-CoA carboxylase carboxyl transferase subunit beta [Alphaproteobacteria bacterium CG_4_10_14_0_2_um_filter_63_37]